MKTASKTTKIHASKPSVASTAAADPTPATAATATAAPAAPAAAPVVPIPTEEQVTQWVNTLEGVRTMLGDAATPLTTQQRRRALRVKKGGEATIGLMVGLGQQYNVQLPGVDPAQIQQSNLLVQRLQPLETKLRVISGLVSDTVGNAKTESWQGTTSLYTALSRASTRNAALQKELEPAVAFFKPKPGTTKKAKKNAAVKQEKEAASVASAPPTEVTPVTPVAVPHAATPVPAAAPAAAAVTATSPVTTA